MSTRGARLHHDLLVAVDRRSGRKRASAQFMLSKLAEVRGKDDPYVQALRQSKKGKIRTSRKYAERTLETMIEVYAITKRVGSASVYDYMQELGEEYTEELCRRAAERLTSRGVFVSEVKPSRVNGKVQAYRYYHINDRYIYEDLDDLRDFLESHELGWG